MSTTACSRRSCSGIHNRIGSTHNRRTPLSSQWRTAEVGTRFCGQRRRPCPRRAARERAALCPTFRPDRRRRRVKTNHPLRKGVFVPSASRLARSVHANAIVTYQGRRQPPAHRVLLPTSPQNRACTCRRLYTCKADSGCWHAPACKNWSNFPPRIQSFQAYPISTFVGMRSERS